MTKQMSLSYFEFKIRLIRPGFFSKAQNPVFELTTYWFQSESAVTTITPKSQL